MAPSSADVFGQGAVANLDTFITSVAEDSDPRVNTITSLLSIVNAAHLTFGIFLLLGAKARERVSAPWAAFALLALATETLLLFFVLGMLRAAGGVVCVFPLLALVAAAIVTSMAIIIFNTRPFTAVDSLPARNKTTKPSGV